MKPLDEEGRQRAETAIRAAKRIAKDYSEANPGLADDLESSALWGAVRAASSYETGPADVWSRWSRLRMRGEIKNFLDESYAKRRTLWPQDQLEAIEDRSSTIVEYDEIEAIDHLLGLLPRRYRDLCSLVYKDGLSPYSAGQALGLTGRHGCRMHREALEQLKAAIAA